MTCQFKKQTLKGCYTCTFLPHPFNGNPFVNCFREETQSSTTTGVIACDKKIQTGLKNTHMSFNSKQ